MSKKIEVRQPPATSEWTPCWSAHYYGFPVWSDPCSCTEERKVAIRAQGRAKGYVEDRMPPESKPVSDLGIVDQLLDDRVGMEP